MRQFQQFRHNAEAQAQRLSEELNEARTALPTPARNDMPKATNDSNPVTRPAVDKIGMHIMHVCVTVYI